MTVDYLCKKYRLCFKTIFKMVYLEKKYSVRKRIAMADLYDRKNYFSEKGCLFHLGWLWAGYNEPIFCVGKVSNTSSSNCSSSSISTSL